MWNLMVGVEVAKSFSSQGSKSRTQSQRGIDMKAVLAIPGGVLNRLLSREICGVALFVRTIATGQRAGVREFLMLSSDAVLDRFINSSLQASPLKAGCDFQL